MQKLTRSSLPALDLAAGPVWTFFPQNLTILASSTAAQEWLGYEQAELDTCTVLNIRPAIEHRKHQPRLEQFSHGGPHPDIWTIIAKSGARYHARMTWRAALFDDAPAIFITIVDVAPPPGDPAAGMPRSDVRAALDDISSRLSAAQEGKTKLRIAEKFVGLGSWDPEFASQTLNWSPRVVEIHGMPPEEGTPDFVEYRAMVNSDDRRRLADTFQSLELSNNPDMIVQYRWMRPDGTIPPIKAAGRKRDLDRKDIVLGFVQDICGITEAHIRFSEVTSLQRITGRAARLGGWRTDFDTNRAIWSPELTAIFKQAEPASSECQDFVKYYVSEHRAFLRHAIAACRETDQPLEEMLQIVSVHGNRMWVRSIGEAVRDVHGRIAAVEGTCQ